jgi:hypothetical protein
MALLAAVAKPGSKIRGTMLGDFGLRRSSKTGFNSISGA